VSEVPEQVLDNLDCDQQMSLHGLQYNSKRLTPNAIDAVYYDFFNP